MGGQKKIDKKSLEFHQKVYSAYSIFYDKYESHSIYMDGDDDILNIHKKIVEAVNKEFNLNIIPLSIQEIDDEYK